MQGKELKEKLQEIVEEVRKRDNFVVVMHYDADGLSAGAIVLQALKRAGKKVKWKVVKQLYTETIEEIKGLGKNFFFVDFGSGLIKELKKSFVENFFVLDHHQPVKEDYRFHLNPYFFGISGNSEVSGSGLSYLFAKELDKENIELVHLAVVGAIGDMQDFDGKLKGLNAEILKEGIENGFLEKKNDLRLYGRISRHLISFLMFSSNPILPELTANEENCVRFLKELGIELKKEEQWRSYEDLSEEEKKKLTTALVLHLNSYNVPEWKLHELVGEVYTIKKEERKSPLRDVKEFSTLLNACGRHGMPEVALQVCLGDRGEEFAKAKSLLVQHRTELREGIELMQEKGVEEFESFYFFDAGEKIKDSIVGIVAGMLYGSGAIESNKPVIAFARHEDGSIKVSARATKELVMRGLNLGLILREICKELGGKSEGGGHKVAAGCRIEEAERKKFLELLNKKIKKALDST